MKGIRQNEGDNEKEGWPQEGEYTKHWYNVDHYISKPFGNQYYIDEFVKEVR